MLWRRVTLGLLAVLLLPGLLFAAIASSRSNVCLESYRWEPGHGFSPVPASCGAGEAPSLAAASAFYARGVTGLLSGQPGASRENASVQLDRLLLRRAGRSLAIVAVVALLIVVTALLRRALSTVLARVGSRLSAESGASVTLVPAGLPVPIAGFVVFALVMRLVPPGSALDFDRAGILWAGVALYLGDGVLFALGRGMKMSLQRELQRRYAETLDLWGQSAKEAAAEVSAGDRAAQIRGALLATFGGLIVVESIFGVNGLGETLKDLVVDRQGLDPLLLCGVLLLFTLGVVAVQLAPLEQLARRWRLS